MSYCPVTINGSGTCAEDGAARQIQAEPQNNDKRHVAQNGIQNGTCKKITERSRGGIQHDKCKDLGRGGPILKRISDLN